MPFFPLLIQPLWRFTDSEMDGTVLVYRSEDIKNISRLASSKVCGYVHAEANDLLPETARRSWGGPEEVEQEKGENCFLQVAPVLGRKVSGGAYKRLRITKCEHVCAHCGFHGGGTMRQDKKCWKWRKEKAVARQSMWV